MRQLIRQMQSANIEWGAPRIDGELLKLGIEIAQATVSKYVAGHRGPPSQTWPTSLDNHVTDLASMDFFTVPTTMFRVLYVFMVLGHNRRKIIHFDVTEHPTAQWTAQQITEALPFDSAQRFLLRDRGGIYGKTVKRRIKSLGIEEVVTAPRSPWQKYPFVERVIASIRRRRPVHVIVFNERHLRRVLRKYLNGYHTCRTHLSLKKDSPELGVIQPREFGNIVAFPCIVGLHHRYARMTA